MVNFCLAFRRCQEEVRSKQKIRRNAFSYKSARAESMDELCKIAFLHSYLNSYYGFLIFMRWARILEHPYYEIPSGAHNVAL